MTRPFDYGPHPVGWVATRLRSVMARKKQFGRPDLPLLSVNLPVGVVVRLADSGRQAPSEDLSGYQVVGRGDLVVNQLGKPHGALGVSEHEGIISPAYFVAEFSPSVEPRFMHHLLRTRLYISEYERRGKYMPPNQFDISWDQFGDIDVLLPPRLVQRRIADYIDTETAHIDAIIAKKQRMIELLRERQKQVAETDLSELRDRTTHLPLKHLVRESDQRRGEDATRILLSVSIHLGVVPRMEASDRESRADDFAKYKTCDPGDVVINRMRAFQGALGVVTTPGVVSPDYTVLKLGSELDPDYSHFLMRSHWFVGEMAARIRGIGAVDQGQVRTPRVNFTDLREIAVPVPRIEEQRRLVTRWRATEQWTSRMIAVLERQDALLVERRQALITAAVSGELEVPGVAA